MKLLVVAALALLVSSQALAQKAAPNFSLKDSEGKTVELSKLRGKAVVVNFWATWCPPCRAEIPAFLSVYSSYKPKGLEILGIALDNDGWSVINPFVKKHKITYPVLLGDGDVVKSYGDIRSIPTTFFIDRKGRIHSSHVGAMSEKDFEQKVKAIL